MGIQNKSMGTQFKPKETQFKLKGVGSIQVIQLKVDRIQNKGDPIQIKGGPIQIKGDHNLFLFYKEGYSCKNLNISDQVKHRSKAPDSTINFTTWWIINCPFMP